MVAINKLIKQQMKTGTKINWKQRERKEMIVDMENPLNILYTYLFQNYTSFQHLKYRKNCLKTKTKSSNLLTNKNKSNLIKKPNEDNINNYDNLNETQSKQPEINDTLDKIEKKEKSISNEKTEKQQSKVIKTSLNEKTNKLDEENSCTIESIEIRSNVDNENEQILSDTKSKIKNKTKLAKPTSKQEKETRVKRKYRRRANVLKQNNNNIEDYFINTKTEYIYNQYIILTI